MGVAPSSLFAYKRSTSRRLNTNVEVSIISKTEYEWTMGPNRSLNLPTPT